MTDRYHALTVVLDQNLRSDDVEGLINAIKLLSHVSDVTPHVANIDTYVAEARAKSELYTKLWEILK